MKECRRAEQAGFTAMELLVTMFLVSVLGYAALPGFREVFAVFNKRNAEIQLLQDLRVAQATTVEQGCQGILTIAGNQESYSFGCDYVPFSASSPPVADTQLFVRNLPTGIRLSANDLVIFNTRGQTVDELGFVTTRTLSLSINEGGSYQTFNTGTLAATGFFTFQH